MNIRAYRLLRNNKEQGPFTAEEIIQKNLKPYDLIWVDGRSAAWSYPGEMQEFKTYVPAPGEENKKMQGSKQETSAISPSVQAAIAMNEAIVQPAIKEQKPRYKVSAAWSKIQTITAPQRSNMMVSESQKVSFNENVNIKHPAGVSSKSLSWEQAWLDWEKEKETVAPVIEPVKIKPAVNPQAKTLNKNYVAPVLETKYTEPLDSLKDKYIENIIQQKQKPKKGFSFGKASEFVVPTIALLVIFSIGYWLLHGKSETAAALSSVPPPSAQPAAVHSTNQAATTVNDNAATKTAFQNSNSESQKNIAPQNNTVVTDVAEDRATNNTYSRKLSVSKQTDALKQAEVLKQQDKPSATPIVSPASNTGAEKAVIQQSKQFDPSVINNVPNDKSYNDASSASTGDLNAAGNRPVRRRTNTDDNTTNSSAQKNETAAIKHTTPKSSTKYVSVPEYIEMSDGSANLKIENVSDVDLDLVVVDVQYYDASNRFRKGETLYLHNLRAGKNVIVKTPKDINSLYAVSKVSLVSSDANKVYVIGDN